MYINHLPVSPQSKTWASTCVRKPQLMKTLKSSELKLHCRRCYLILPSAVFIHTLICLGAGGGTCWVKSKHWPSWKFTEQAGGKKKKKSTSIACIDYCAASRCSQGPRAEEGAPSAEKPAPRWHSNSSSAPGWDSFTEFINLQPEKLVKLLGFFYLNVCEWF